MHAGFPKKQDFKFKEETCTGSECALVYVLKTTKECQKKSFLSSNIQIQEDASRSLVTRCIRLHPFDVIAMLGNSKLCCANGCQEERNRFFWRRTKDRVHPPLVLAALTI